MDTPLYLSNVVARDGLGTHRYANRSLLRERNGVLYTCAGGLIDTAHVRSAADLAAYIFRELRRAPGETLHFEDSMLSGMLRLEVREPSDRELIAVAIRATYEISVWHETLTALGHGTVEFIDEGYSAFSPEDLYSDLLGALLGAAAVQDPQPYEQAMNRLLPALLTQLGAVEPPATRAFLDANLLAWSPQKKIPDIDLLRERRFDYGPDVTPWSAGWSCGMPAHDLKLPAAVPYSLTFAVPAELRATLGRDRVQPAEFDALVSRAQRAVETRAAQTHEPDFMGPGLRIMPLALLGGVSHGTALGATSGLSGAGVDVRTVGGEGTIMAYHGFLPRGDGDWVSDFTAVDVQALYGCRDRYRPTWHPPVSALVAPCQSSWFGVGGTLFRARHLARSNEVLLRPIALQASLHLAGPAYTAGYWRHRARLTLGGALDVVGSERRVSTVAYSKLQLRLGSLGPGWSVEPTLGGSVAPRGSWLLEAGARVGVGFRAGPDASPWGTLRVGVDSGLVHHRDAEGTIPFIVSGLVVSEETSWVAQGFVSWVWDALVL